MEFGLAFSFPFKDEDWFKKVAIIGLIALIPIIGWFVLYGWGMQVAKKVIRKEPEPVKLPELEFGAQLSLGFQAWLIQLVYAIPLIILILPISIVPSLGAMLEMDGNTLGIITAVVSCICGGLSFIYALVMTFMLPMAMGRFLDQGSVGAAFKLGEVFGLLKAAPVAVLVAILGAWIASLIGSLGSIACGIGIIVTMPYAVAITGHLYGQAYNQGMAHKSVA